MELGLGRKVRNPTNLAVVGQGLSHNEDRPQSRSPSRPLSRPSQSESMRNLADYSKLVSYGGAYDTNVPPLELRTQNLYIQSIQHRQPQVC